MICPSCQAEVGATDSYCAFCGARLLALSVAKLAASADQPDSADSSRRWPVVLALVLLHVLLFGGSAWGVYTLLERRSPRPQLTLGAPYPVPARPAQGVPASQAGTGAESAPPVATTPKPHQVASLPGRVLAPTQAARKVKRSSARRADKARPAEAPATAGAPGAAAQDRAGQGARQDAEAEVTRPAAAAPAPADQPGQANAAYNADSARMVVQHHQPQVRMCYDRAQKQAGPIGGMIEVQLTIEQDGKVDDAHVRRNTTGHEGLGRCLVALFKSWRFPRPAGGGADLVYPFLFSTGEE